MSQASEEDDSTSDRGKLLVDRRPSYPSLSIFLLGAFTEKIPVSVKKDVLTFGGCVTQYCKLGILKQDKFILP